MEKTKRKAPPRRTTVQTSLSKPEMAIVEGIADKLECSLAEAIRHAIVTYSNY